MSDELFESLEKILSVDSASAEIEDEILKPLLDDIELIRDKDIAAFVRTVLLMAPSHFWDCPSDLSDVEGTPPDELLPGGGVLHTKRVVAIVIRLADAQDHDSREMDCLIAAALLHDITKMGVGGDPIQDEMHPYTLDLFVRSMYNTDIQSATEGMSSSIWTKPEDIELILRLVRCQEGYNSVIPETVPTTMLEWIMHFAERIASDLHYIVDPTEEVKFWRWALPDEC